MKFTSYRTAYVLLLLIFIRPQVTYADQFSERMAELGIATPKERMLAPDFNLHSLTGSNIRLSDYRGQLVLLNFWGTFCAPCREEMPALESLWQKFRGEGLVVLTIAVDRGSETEVSDYIQTGNFTFLVALDPDADTRNEYEVKAFPSTYLIGRDGKFLGRAMGIRDWWGDSGQSLIQLLLDGGFTY